jgi:hypothetical protein
VSLAHAQAKLVPARGEAREAGLVCLEEIKEIGCAYLLARG